MEYNFEEDIYFHERVLDSPEFPFEEFKKYFADAKGNIDQDIVGYMHRWHRIFVAMNAYKSNLEGPTLDVASGNGSFYRSIKNFFPHLLKYSITEFEDSSYVIDGDTINCSAFHCEKDRAPFTNNSFNFLLFCDVLEHLAVDPMWTLFEFNRILNMGGKVLISTPNVCCIQRVLRILSGISPNTEHFYKPAALYQRHNREWTPDEVHKALELSGFKTSYIRTFPEVLANSTLEFGKKMQSLGYLNYSETLFGPEIIVIAEKVKEVSLDLNLPDDIRWPQFLYTGHAGYRKRPKQFPIVIGDDYYS